MAFKIVLLGYMGSGKTAVGKELANILSIEFKDLDLEIEKDESKSISQIFDSKGALYFRKKEKQILEQIIQSNVNEVISLGGGTPCYYDTMEFLNKNDHVSTIYLDVSIAVLANRLINEKEQRPLLNNITTQQELLEFIGKHLFERRPFYNKAQYVLKTLDHDVNEISKEIVALLF